MGCSHVPKEVKVQGSLWERGWIVEDVWLDKSDVYESWEPHVQAVRNEQGALALRFCYWKRNLDGTRGVFVRSPMLIYDSTIEDLRDEARKHRAHTILILLNKLAK